MRPPNVSIVVMIAACAGLSGCLGVTAERHGPRSMPVELRSSSDVAKPFVGAVNAPSTQPSRLEQALEIPTAIFDLYTDKPLVAAGNLQHPSPNVRRAAIETLAARRWGREEQAYRRTYRALAAADSDPVVRATAVRAINRSRDPDAAAVLVRALADGDDMVRLEAAKALANLPTPIALGELLKLLADESQDQDLRIAVADALRHFDNPSVHRALVDRLNENNFAVAWQARRSLYLMTSQDFRYDEAAWLNYFAQRA